MNSPLALEAATESASHVSSPTIRTGNGSSFEALGLNPALLETVADLGYSEPTPIQTRAIPEVLSGRDVLGLAQTGTGKTAAFLLPIIHKLLAGEPGSPRVLVVVPTRELAEQVLASARDLCRGTGLRAMSMYGGVRIESQIRQLRQPLDIIVGCPGRILDLLEQRALSLDSIEYLVLDEADQMFDMGFIVPIRKLLRALPRERQSLLFSATMPPEISGLAQEALHNPVKVQVAPISSPATVTHRIYPVSAHLKQKLLTHLLNTMSSESVLVFTRTKHKAKKLARSLERDGIKATSLQGNLSQQQRMHAMSGFRNGKYSVMVATDIASRGIDVSSVTHVVNFDLPDTTEAYIHRTGRTGRAARNGDALSFITPGDEGELRRFERALRVPFKRTVVEGFDYEAKPEPEENTLGGFSHAGPRRERGGYRRGGQDNRSRFRNSRRDDYRGRDAGRDGEAADRREPSRTEDESRGNRESSNRSRPLDFNQRSSGSSSGRRHHRDGGDRREGRHGQGPRTEGRPYQGRRSQQGQGGRDQRVEGRADDRRRSDNSRSDGRRGEGRASDRGPNRDGGFRGTGSRPRGRANSRQRFQHSSQPR